MDNDALRPVLSAAKIAADSITAWQNARHFGFPDLAAGILETGLATALVMVSLNQAPRTPSEETTHTLEGLIQAVNSLRDSLTWLVARKSGAETSGGDGKSGA